MKRKLKVSVFTKAARIIEKDLKSPNGNGPVVCGIFANMMGEDSEKSPEFKLFRKLFGNHRSIDNYWFGTSDFMDYNTCRHRPHKKNQMKRIKALRRAAVVAAQINKRLK